ncbi:MAG: BamA/TamA family outer membrane protein [Hyphomonadaceae bacterium]
MRFVPVFPAALCAALGLAMGPTVALADSPVVIEGGDEDMREGIIDLLPDRDRPTTLFEAERIAEEAAARAIAWLRSEGYYAAEVTPEASDEPPSARLDIRPGMRFTFAAPEITYADEPPRPEAREAAQRALAHIQPGAPARAEAVLAAEAETLGALQRNGYADASAGERLVIVDHATTEVRTELRFETNALIRLGQVRADPSDVLRPGFVHDLRNWEYGEIYRPDDLSRLRRDLTSTGAVTRAVTRIQPANEDGVSDVVLEIEPAPKNAYELGLGYSTTEGVGVEAEWTRRNFTGRADSLTVGTTLSERLQSLSTELSRPHAAGLGRTGNFGIVAAREDTTAFTRQGLAVYASIDASPRLQVGESYGLRLSADTYDSAAGGGVSDAFVLSGFFETRHDTTEQRFDPLDGSITEFRIEPSISTGDATLGFVRFIGEGRTYHSFTDEDRLTLAARARLGWLEAVSGDVEDVPPDRRFYAGGGGSVRGYDYNSIYPPERDTLGLTPGGQGLFEGSVEARWRFGDRLGAVAFVDGGNAFDDWSDAGDLRWGVGVGARYNLGFAPLRVDIAFPLDDDETQDDFALYISLGQAF